MIDNPIVILIGRFILGMSAGSFSVFCPKFVAEMAPAEYRGPFGSLNQLMCTVGIFVVACLGIPLPATPFDDHTPENEFLIKQYWRVIWGIPIVIAFI